MVSRSSPAEKRQVQLTGVTIDYTLKRSVRKTLGLKIDRHGLVVSVPMRASEKAIGELLAQHAGWILDKLDSMAAAAPAPWQDGATLWLRGEPLWLRLGAGPRASTRLTDDTLTIMLPDPDNQPDICAALRRFYQREARADLPDRVARHAQQMRVQPGAVLLTSARTRWGSCNGKGEIRLNWRLLMAPDHLIDYVVIHELAHLLEMNHSARFWAHVTAMCPQWRAYRAELNHNAAYYRLV